MDHPAKSSGKQSRPAKLAVAMWITAALAANPLLAQQSSSAQG